MGARNILIAAVMTVFLGGVCFLGMTKARTPENARHFVALQYEKSDGDQKGQNVYLMSRHDANEIDVAIAVVARHHGKDRDHPRRRDSRPEKRTKHRLLPGEKKLIGETRPSGSPDVVYAYRIIGARFAD